MRSVLKSVIKGLVGGVSALTVCAAAAYPERPINMVVVFGPGGTSDVVARQFSQALADVLGSEVVVQNRPGAGGNVGASSVARATPDGYTLLAGFPGLTTNGALYKNLNYDPVNDFIPISRLASAPNVIVVPPTSTAQNLQQLIEQGRQKAGGMNFGSAGPGSSSHLAGELLKEKTGMNLVHVPYKGGAPALVDLTSGRIDLMIIPAPEAASLINSGKIKALALASDQRSSLLPDVPTTAQAGLSDFVVGSWYGFLAPRGVPDNVLATLKSATTKALQSEALKNYFQTAGIELVASSPEDFEKFLADERKRWGAVIEKNQIRLD